MEVHQGRASQHQIILGKLVNNQGQSNTISEEEDEGQDKRGGFGTKEHPGQGQPGRAGRRRHHK